jgi:hypothetical protein
MRAVVLFVVAAAIPSRSSAQCPSGAPPPCRAPVGRAQLRVMQAVPTPGTTLFMDSLLNGIPVHVVLEQVVRRSPRGQIAKVYLLAGRPIAGPGMYEFSVVSSHAGSWTPMQFAVDGTLCPQHDVGGMITLQVSVIFDRSRDSSTARTPRGTLDLASSTLLEYPVRGTLRDTAAVARACRGGMRSDST